MGIQGRAPRGGGKIIPPRGGSGWVVLPKGHSANFVAPPPPQAFGNCRGCGAALRVATCDYCGRTEGPAACAPGDPRGDVAFLVEYK